MLGQFPWGPYRGWQGGHGLRLLKDLPWRGEGRRPPGKKIRLCLWIGRYKLFAVQKTVSNEFAGA